MTPEERAEVFAFARARITEDRDRALNLYKNKSEILDSSQAASEDPDRDPEQYGGIYFGLLVAAGYKDHAEYKPHWDRRT